MVAYVISEMGKYRNEAVSMLIVKEGTIAMARESERTLSSGSRADGDGSCRML